MHTTKFVHCCDVVPNMVVDFQILNFCLFVPHVLLILENVPIFIPKTVLKSGLWRGKVSDLLVDIAICNFDLFHFALLQMASLLPNWPKSYCLNLTSITPYHPDTPRYLKSNLEPTLWQPFILFDVLEGYQCSKCGYLQTFKIWEALKETVFLGE